MHRPAVSVSQGSTVLDPVGGFDDAFTSVATLVDVNMLGDSALDVSAAAISDSHVLESGAFDSPSPEDSGDYYLAGDSAFSKSTLPFDFDINEYLNNNEWLEGATNSTHPTADNQQFADGISTGFETGHGLQDPTTSSSPEDPNLQPQLGASALGCDAGGIAVGAI